MSSSGTYRRASNHEYDGRRRRVPYSQTFQDQGSSVRSRDQPPPSFSHYASQEYSDAHYGDMSSDGYYSSYYDSSSQPSAYYNDSYYNDSYTGPSHAQSLDFESSYDHRSADSRADYSSHPSYSTRAYDDFDPYSENPFAVGNLDDVVERPQKRRKRKHDMNANVEVEDVSGDVRLRMERDRQLYNSLMQPNSDDADTSPTLSPVEDPSAAIATENPSVASVGLVVHDGHAGDDIENAQTTDKAPVQVDAPPPDAPPPPPLGPSQEYLESVTVQSEYSETPHDRKLLILDLNGTLVFRAGPRSAGQQRRVFARPYFDAFRQYIFHAKTNIDVMVWSSAQPQNVADMVSKCFGKSYADIVAIWDRTYFDLSKADYNKKSVTIKDLEKPWAFYTRRAATNEVDSENNNENNVGEAHSARTTFLLDDSTVKAQLQPYNHLCLREYDEDATRAARGLVLRATADPAPEDTLLAIIGILEHARHESNVAHWVHDGGLWAGHTPPHATTDDLASSSSLPPSDDAGDEVIPGNDAALNPLEPSSTQTPQPMWFDHPKTYAHWVEAGREALKALGIPDERGTPSEPIQLSKT